MIKWARKVPSDQLETGRVPQKATFQQADGVLKHLVAQNQKVLSTKMLLVDIFHFTYLVICI